MSESLQTATQVSHSPLLAQWGVPVASGKFLSASELHRHVTLFQALRARRAGFIHPDYLGESRILDPLFIGAIASGMLGFALQVGLAGSVHVGLSLALALTGGVLAASLSYLFTLRSAAVMTATRQWLSEFPCAHLQQLLETNEVEGCSETRRVVYDILAFRQKERIPPKLTALEALAGKGAKDVLALTNAQSGEGETL